MAKAASSDKLRAAFEKHQAETEGQVDRLEQVFEMLDKPARGKTCDAIVGILDEGKEIMEEYKGTDALDAGMLAAAQAVEHYEISRYGTLKTWATELGMNDAARLLDQTLKEEEKTDRKAWVFAQWTTDLQLAAQIDHHVAHYTNQEELSQNIREGQAALASGDNERATRMLGRALQLSQQTGNENMTRMLNKLVVKDSSGTVRLNKNASEVERKTIAINSGKTTRLK